jgi:hypothetical protein
VLLVVVVLMATLVAVTTPVTLIPDELIVTAVAPSPAIVRLVGVILPEATLARLTPPANT